jgi:hypothetical protein
VCALRPVGGGESVLSGQCGSKFVAVDNDTDDAALLPGIDERTRGEAHCHRGLHLQHGSRAAQPPTLQRQLNQWDWEAAAHELQRWVYGVGWVLPVLVTYRDAEAGLLAQWSQQG